MHLAWLVALDHDRREGAQLLGDEPVVDSADGEKHRERRPPGTGLGIREQEHAPSRPHGCLGLGDDPAERGLEPLLRLEGRVEPLGPECGEGTREQEEALQLDPAGRVGALYEDRRAPAEQRAEREDEPLAKVVDGWIRHLGETLAEERVQRPRTPGERGERGVVAHRRGRLVAVRRGRAEDHAQVLLRVPEGSLPRREIVVGHGDGCAAAAADEPALEPLAVGSTRGEPALHRGVLLEAALGIDRDHLARPQLAAAHRPGGQVHHAGLGRADDEIAADRVAERPQAVPVQRRAHHVPVGEDERGGAVPGLAEARVVAVEVAHVRVELDVSLPRLGHEHRLRVPDVPAAADEQLEDVVEHRRVGPARVDDGREQGVVVRAQAALTRAHPVDVALDRVDLAVVAEQAERLRALPGGRGVGREALVEDAERDLERRVAQVVVEDGELIGRAERLVGDRAERERGDVRGDRALGELAGPEGTALRLVGIEARSRQEQLLDPRRTRLRLRPERVRGDRHLTPPEHLQPFLATDCCKDLAVGFVAEEDHAEPGAGHGQQRRGKREQQAGTVARLPVGRNRSAVLDAPEPFEQRVDDLARCTAAHVRDEADAAGIELGGTVVQRAVGRHEAPVRERTDGWCRASALWC